MKTTTETDNDEVNWQVQKCYFVDTGMSGNQNEPSCQFEFFM
jgi:hypothetical protein